MRLWLHGCVAAAIGGASSALSAAFALPDAVNFSHAGLLAMGKISMAGAVLAVAAYLRQSPLPPR